MRWFYLIPNQKIISPTGELLWLSHSKTDMKAAKNHQLMIVSKCLLHPSAPGMGEASPLVIYPPKTSPYFPLSPATPDLVSFSSPPSPKSFPNLVPLFPTFSSLEHNLKRRESLCDCWHQTFLSSEEERVSETELKFGPGTSRPIHLLLAESMK